MYSMISKLIIGILVSDHSGVNERLEAIKILLPSTHSSEADQAMHDANVVTMCTSHMQR
jgi:hypothetical protein